MSQSPSGFFCFKHNASDGVGAERTYVVAFKVAGPLAKGALEDLVVAMIRGPDIPDAVVILCLEHEQRIVTSALTEEIGRLGQERLSGRIPLLVAAYKMESGAVRATLMDRAFARRAAALRMPMESNVERCLRSGLSELFKSENTLLQAPPGYAYHKPRGSRSRFFLKPDMALVSSAAVGFVALAVYHRAFASIRRSTAEFVQIFVDSMAISPVAYALRDLLLATGVPNAISVESFHSYRGFAEMPRPLPGTSLCLISASSSMSLHADWLREKQVGREEALTLLTFDDAARNRDGALFSIRRPRGETTESTVPLSIHITGESFLPVPEPTKKVLLTEPAHKCPDETSMLQLLAGRQIFDIFRRPAVPNSKPRALFVDGAKLLASDEFKVWVGREVRQKFKAATRVVIYQDDASSLSFAQLVKRQAEEEFQISGLRLLSSTALVESRFSGDEGVVVCSAVAGKGAQLLQVSRDLRDKQSGPRLYLIGFQVAELRTEIETLISNLRFSKTASYDVVRFAGFAIGSELGESYLRETAAYFPASASLGRLPPALSTRAALIGGVASAGHRSLLPIGSNLSSGLELRPGFAFWEKPYPAAPFHSEVLATIAIILQRAREEQKIVPEKRLSSGMFGHVALDPANFSRFNDGVIQAALLRCSRASELDYRSDYAASDFMKALLLKMLERSEGQTGEAILEFMGAVGVRHLQLIEEHLREVVSAAQGVAAGRPLGKAIKFLLKPLSDLPPTPSKLPF